MTRLLVSGVDFGWGSAGKLSAVLEALRLKGDAELHVTGIGTALGRRIMPHGLVDAWIDHDAKEDGAVQRVVTQLSPDAGIVVLDPRMADEFAAAGCPVVYVDSLPYLWTAYDPLPRMVARYCAQRTLTIPPHAARALATVPALTWIDPIVSPSLARATPRPRRHDVLLVNVGGIHAPLAHRAAADQYLALVLPPLAVAAASRGVRRLVLAGNVSPDQLPVLGDVTVELLNADHTAFLSWLGEARWIATSPGLTTLLEIAALGRVATLLPPQNLSQCYHLAHVAASVGSVFTIPWPSAVLNPKHVSAWQLRGEEYAVGRIYAAISAAAGMPMKWVHDEIREASVGALAACDSQPSAFHALAPAHDGAFQVANYVGDVAALSLGPR